MTQLRYSPFHVNFGCSLTLLIDIMLGWVPLLDGEKMQLSMLRKLHHHSRVNMTKYDITLKKLTKLTRGGMMTNNQIADSVSET